MYAVSAANRTVTFYLTCNLCSDMPQCCDVPFGFRNGPAAFQCVMQNVLAPSLWIYALVYIDNIVVFSRNFEEHFQHLDNVFKAMAKSGITLSLK
jgi:hypothetical protein